MVVQKRRDEDGRKAVKARNKQEQSEMHEVKKTVVEYLVLQQRVIHGDVENWKVWGFTEESTPETVAHDESYWRRTIDMQAS
jgi:protein MBA1